MIRKGSDHESHRMPTRSLPAGATAARAANTRTAIPTIATRPPLNQPNARSADAAPTTGTQAASHGPRRSSSGFDEVGWVPDSVRVLRTETEKTSQEVCRKVLGTRFASFLVPAIGLLSAARSDAVSGTSKKSKLLGTSSRLRLRPLEASDLDRT